MKALVCETCNSNDLVKQDGYFVCQCCGTKYSVEEAKKTMVEVDNTKKISNLYERARKSLEVDDLEHAAEYYKQILDENPNDWEAYFYSYLGEFVSFTNAQAGTVADKLGNTIPAAYDMALKNCSVEEAVNRIKIITQKTSDRLIGIAATGAALLRQYEGGNILFPAGKVNVDLYQRIRPTVVNTITSCVLAYAPIESKLEEIFENNSEIDKEACKENLLYIRRARYSIADMQFESSAGIKEYLIKAELIHEYAVKINELDSSFEVPSVESKTNSSDGCYVATAVYGSYDCPQVWTLRRFRDYTLAETWYGRAFIHTYYAISPTIVKWFGKTEWFKKMWRSKLDKMVYKLNENGVENTPYEDKKW